MYFRKDLEDRCNGLVASQNEKSILRTGTTPKVITEAKIDRLQYHAMPSGPLPDTIMARQRAMRARYGTVSGTFYIKPRNR